MNPQCIKEVEKVLGRKMRKGEADDIGERISGNMRVLAKDDPQWQSKSAGQRLDAAAQLARQQDIARADKQAQRRALNVAAQSRNLAQMQRRVPEMKTVFSGKEAKTPGALALRERILQVANAAKGVRDDVIEKFLPAMELLKDSKREPEFLEEVLRGGSKDPMVRDAVKSYLEGVESLRERANANGMDVGKLDYNYLPTPHDTGKIARVTGEKFAADVLGMMKSEDRARYLNTDGTRKTDAQMMKTLQAIHETLSTEGTNKDPTNAYRGTGSRASRSDNKHRELHLVSPEAWSAYTAMYGRGGVMESIFRHVDMQSKNIAMIEEMGPNPNATFQLLDSHAQNIDRQKNVQINFATNKMAFDSLNGTMATPVSVKWAFRAQEVRSFFTSAKLGGLLITQLTDLGRLLNISKLNGIPLGKAFFGLGKELFAGSEHKMALRRRGIGIDDLNATMGRWALDELYTHGLFSKLSQTLTKWTGARAWDAGMRNDSAINTSGMLHDMKGTAWNDIDPGMRYRWESAGITERDWKVFRQAEGTDYRGAPILDKQGIRAIPDAKMDVALADEHEANRQAMQAQVDVLDAHNQQDQQWMAGREAQFQQLQKDTLARRDINKSERDAIIASNVLAPKLAETQEFKERAMDRQAKRDAVIQRLSNLEPQKAALRTQARNQAIAHLLGYLDAEGNNIIPRPNVATKAGMLQGTQPGTVGGEAARFAMMYKGFGFQTIAALKDQLRSVPDAKGKMGLLGATLASTTLLGAVSYQLHRMIGGEDPEDMTQHPVNFAAKAIMQGGGFGIISEAMNALLGGNQKGSKIGDLAGPVGETVGEIGSMIHDQVNATQQGKPSTAAGDATKIALENTPFLNLWYVKAIIHHAFLDALQESISPGYLDRMRRADQRNNVTRFIPRGSSEPIRAPNLAKAVGETP